MGNVEVNIPIPHYPPFKLRSSLIDKDPVIWVHLLEGYIDLFRVLEGDQSIVLSVKSEKQLQLFLKVFLKETSDESTKIFALGNINPQIKENESTLKVYVFQYVKNHSIVKCNFTAESIWHFVCIYVEKNASTVRGLVDGTFVSKLNDNKKSGKVNSIPSLQKYIETLILKGNFLDRELNFYSLLVGQYITSVKRTKAFVVTPSASENNDRVINKRKFKSNAFAESFVDKKWIEKLESLYADGKSRQAKWIEKIMIMSMVSLSISGLSKLATELGINSIHSLRLSPLFSTILISDPLKDLIPGIEDRLPFLRNVTFASTDSTNGSAIKDEDVSTLLDMFPNITSGKAVSILTSHNGNVSKVIETLLDSPTLIDDIPEAENGQSERTTSTAGEADKSLSTRFTSKEKTKILRKRKINSIENSRPSNDHKEKTLEAALRLMYETDEDEPDDTYQDTEITGDPATTLN